MLRVRQIKCPRRLESDSKTEQRKKEMLREALVVQESTRPPMPRPCPTVIHELQRRAC